MIDIGVGNLLPYFDSDRAMDVAVKILMWKEAIWGQLQVLMYLHLRSAFGCTSRAMDYAAAYGHVDCVAFLRIHRNEGCSQQALMYAAANGHLECVKYLWRHPPPTQWHFATQAEEAARANKHWAVVKFLRRSLNNRTTSSLQHRATKLLGLLWS
ncbi:hypothetical protein THRCLA_21312 [Thraustotheca clavata]|uniref:Uncharacterized protein n=1 Tax=Thraustotheca clavata TaxID=74557 RepID=A0A1V9ZYG0_9STRA|nr:hypothetical protein THRCLA_21312 [Thraustotheca clavata]